MAKRQIKSLQFVFELQIKESISHKQTQGQSMREREQQMESDFQRKINQTDKAEN